MLLKRNIKIVWSQEWSKTKGSAAPTLFNLALEWVIRKMQNNRKMNNIIWNNMLAYIDVIVELIKSKAKLIMSTLKLLENGRYFELMKIKQNTWLLQERQQLC